MYPKAYIDYLLYFHASRDYFECHEVLEDYWKTKEKEERENHWVGLIQIAVGLYHYRRNHYKGAYKMIKNARIIIGEEQKKITDLGLDAKMLLNELTKLLASIQKQERYYDINLPIIDENLLKSCQAKCKEQGETWCQPSDLSNQYLVNKHSLRDRSEVIAERERQKERRKKKRKE